MVRSDICVGAIVLAAGQSRRMGQNKLLQPLSGKPVVRHVVDAVNRSLAEPAIVVTGHESAMVAAAVAGARVSTVYADGFAAGMSQSLRAGFLAVPRRWDAALVCLGDMPLLSSPMIDAITALARPDRAIVPVCRDVQGNPVLWGRAFFHQLTMLGGDKGAKDILAARPDSVIKFDWPYPDEFRDVDTSGALDAVRAIIADAADNRTPR